MSKWQCSACEGGPCSYEDKLTREECGAVGPEECPRRWQDSNWQPSDGNKIVQSALAQKGPEDAENKALWGKSLNSAIKSVYVQAQKARGE